jgi:hypothetical protein
MSCRACARNCWSAQRSSDSHSRTNVLATLAAMLAQAATMKMPGFALKEPEHA